jgi:tetratricopeptide (TPR) repeat protein
MKPESVAFAVAGALFGLIVGWIIGSQQQAQVARVSAPAAQAESAPASSSPAPKPLDEEQVRALRTITERDAKNVEARVQLGNLFFDSERYQDAIKYYEEAIALKPSDPNVSTDLGVAYYYLNQPDRALKQFDHSLGVDPKHVKTLLNMGIVRAFGKQDLKGATSAWEQVIKLAPDSPEGQTAKRALDSLKAAHPGGTGGS